MTRVGRALWALGWCALAGCAPLVHISTRVEAPPPATAAVGLDAAFRVGLDSLSASLRNRGDQPLEVLWAQSVLIGVDGRRWSVSHGPARGSADATPSTIAAGVTLDTIIRPLRPLDVAAGARVPPFSPVRCGPVECADYETLVGRTLALELVVRSGIDVHTYTWRFQITRAVSSTRGGRPTDPELVPLIAPTPRALGAAAYPYM